MIEHPSDRHMHAISRRAIDEQKPVGRPTDLERAVERQGIGSPAAIALGRNHGHLAQRAHCLRKRSQAGGKITVVITDQNSHERILGHPATGRLRSDRVGAINCFQASHEYRL